MRTICLLCTLLIAVYAQEPMPATLKGRVVDSSSASVAGAAIRARRAQDGKTTSAVSDALGNYSLLLRPGEYSLTVEAPGFAKSTREGLMLRVGQAATVDFTLEIAHVTERLTVTAKAPPLEGAHETETRNFEEVLEIREVRESSAKDVGEALTKIDGLWKIRKGGIANDIVLRGFQQENLNVLVDGVRIYGACPNNMDPPAFHVDFAEISHVEVTKGAFDIKNQGSLGGAVNILNKNPEQGLRITPSLSVGSFGYFNPSVTASLAGEKFYGLAGQSYRRSKPYADGAGSRFTDYANYRESSRNLNAFDINTAWFKFGLAPSHGHRLELGYTRQGGDEILYPYLLMDGIYDNADRWNASYLISDLSSTLKQLQIQGYFTRVKHWMTDEHRLSSVGALRPYKMGTFAATKTLGGRVEALFSDFTGGFEVYRRNWNGVTTMGPSGKYMDQHSIPNVNVSVAGLYGQYQRLFFDRLRLTAGARLDTATSEARSETLNTDLYWAYKGTRSIASTDTTPSGSAWIAYSLPAGLEIFAGLGHTSRLPDAHERYFALKRMGSDWVGNPSLKPTRNTELDFGIGYRGRKFSLRPTLFYSSLADFVTVHGQPKVNDVPYVMNSVARSFENVQATIYGGELGYSVGLSRAVLLFGGLSWSQGTKELKPHSGIFDRNLAEMPPLRSRTVLRFGTRRFFWEVEGLAFNAQDRVDSDLREERTPGYAVMNLKAGVHASKLNLSVGVDNLLDRLYWEHFSYQRDAYRSGARVPEPGRSVYLTVSYGF